MNKPYTGRLQRTIQWVIQNHGFMATRVGVRLGYVPQSSHNSAQRRKTSLNRARAVRRACVSLGLIKVGWMWREGNIWGLKPGTDLAQRLPVQKRSK